MPTRPLAELEARPFFRRTLLKRTLFLGLALVVDLVVLALVAALQVDVRPREGSLELLGFHVWLAFASGHSYAWMGAILLAQVFFAHWAFRRMLDAEGMTSLYPVDRSGGRSVAGFSGPQLVRMVHELAEQMGVGPIRRIVLSDRPDPNAYTAHLLGLGNIVVLHANLLEILPPEGVRAIVAHEVAHMLRKDSLTYLVIGFPRSFIALLGLIILWKIGVGIFAIDSAWVLGQRLLFLAVVWSTATFVLSRLGRITNLAAQQSEHLADAYAAAAVGVEPTLNALLLVGERAEALTVLQQTLAKLPHLKGEDVGGEQMLRILRRFPPRELDHHKASRLASRLYIEERLADLRDRLCVPLAEADIVELARQADSALKQRQEQASDATAQERAAKAREEGEKEADLEKALVDWRQYDFNRSGYLDMQETAALVEDLRRDPTKMLFRQFLEADAAWTSHPTMRDRVLYLYDAFRAGVPA